MTVCLSLCLSFVIFGVLCAMGLDDKLEYFPNFRSADISANDPTPVAALSTHDCANVLTTVTSHTNYFPLFHGISATPSGCLPSCLTNAQDSLVAGILAEPKVRQMMSFSAYGVWRISHAPFYIMKVLDIHLITTYTTVWDT